MTACNEDGRAGSPATAAGSQARSKAAVLCRREKPPAIEVRSGDVPADLRALPQWVCWRWEWREKNGEGRWDKLPVDPRNGGAAAVDDPATRGAFDTALDYHLRHPKTTDGIGFVFTADDPFTGVDFDDALGVDGVPLPWASELLADLASYTEVSPTRTGVKVIVQAAWSALAGGAKPRNKKRYRDGEVEGYDRGRFFTVTGHRLPGTPSAVAAAQAVLQRLYDRVFGEAKAGPRHEPASARPAELSDDELLDRAGRAKGGDRFRRLWAGDTSGYDSPSEADAALLRRLAFWTGPDAGRLDSLFRRSGLYREDKWGDRPDYRQRTIAFVLAGMTEFYEQRNGVAPPARPPASGEIAAPPPRTAHAIILEHFKRHYLPSFRRGLVVYSGALCREVKSSEACFSAPLRLIEDLQTATDAPRTKGVVIRDDLPPFFRRWAPVAWTDLLGELPEEENAPELAPDAGQEFRRRVASGLNTLVSMGNRIEDARGRTETEVERRSLLHWCQLWAKPGPWRQVRSFSCWICSEGPPPAGRLRIAIRCELFDQLHRGDPLSAIGAPKFTRLCGMYDVGGPLKAGGERAVELSAEFLAELLAGPDGVMADGGPRTHAHARSTAQTPKEAERA